MANDVTQLEVFPSLAPLEVLSPLFRWPGGKRWLVRKLLPLLPQDHGSYFEPFFGAGALYFAARPKLAVLSDVNAQLMGCYEALRRDHVLVARLIREIGDDEDSYYEVRRSDPADEFESAARMIYLTAHAFNGIYRVNRRGKFNVPYGGRRYPNLGSEENLARYAAALKEARIEVGDFALVLQEAVAGDLVYLDPPYTVAHANNGFVKYNDRIFSWVDQERLARVARDLSARGCHVIVSNAHHESIRCLYDGFQSMSVTRTSVMAADPGRRGVIREYILTNVPLENTD